MADQPQKNGARGLFGGLRLMSPTTPTPDAASTVQASSAAAASDLARRIAAEQATTRPTLDARRSSRAKPVNLVQVNLKVDAEFKRLLIELSKHHGTSIVGLVEMAIERLAAETKGSKR